MEPAFRQSRCHHRVVAALGTKAAAVTLVTPPSGHDMEHPHRGSCLCGAVRFEVEGTFQRFYLCHCEYCRKDTGSAHAANLFASGAKLTWLSGQDKVICYALPSTQHRKCFCSICGSAMPRCEMEGATVVVPAGSLDSGVSIRPDAHIFVASRADWDHALSEVPLIERLPPSPR